ncbi:MAG: Ger(x)C family spore germination protein [Oscillospiraceae bacterium]|jgi:Ger(x)C family germination protein|nr:Ger(x)C family spore germination protein [Oscillospiraceae bacterium]
MIRRILALVMVLSTILFACGCNGSVELNKLAIVMAIGVDASDADGKASDDKYMVTVQVVRPAVLRAGASGGSGDSDTASFNAHEKGNAVYSALAKLSNMTSRQIFMKQCEALIIGREVAEDDITPVLEYFLRNEEGRMTIPVFIAADTALDVLSESTYLESMPAVQLAGLATNHKYTDKAYAVSVFELTRDLLSVARQPLIPIIDTFLDGAGERKARITGLAVFKKNRMVGVLESDEIFGAHIINGVFDNGLIVIERGGQTAEFMISSAESDMRIRFENGKFGASLSVSVECQVVSTTFADDIFDTTAAKRLSDYAGDELLRKIELAIDKARELNTDFLGVGQLAYQKYPKEYARLDGGWSAAFTDVPIDVDLQVSMLLMGASQKSLTSGGVTE